MMAEFAIGFTCGFGFGMAVCAVLLEFLLRATRSRSQ